MPLISPLVLILAWLLLLKSITVLPAADDLLAALPEHLIRHVHLRPSNQLLARLLNEHALDLVLDHSIDLVPVSGLV